MEIRSSNVIISTYEIIDRLNLGSQESMGFFEEKNNRSRNRFAKTTIYNTPLMIC